MSALAIILTTAMTIPADGPEKVSGEIECLPQPLDLSGKWKAVLYRRGEALEGEAAVADGRLRFCLHSGAGKSISLFGEVDDEGNGNLRVCRCLGIYKQEGNRLRICLNLSGLQRPASFQPGDRECLLILRRVKSRK